MGLTPEQLSSVQAAWKIVEGNLKLHGGEIMFILINGHRDYQKKFKAFADVPIASLKGNAELVDQGFKVISALGKCINVIQNEKDLKSALEPVIASHKPRGVQLPQFKHAFEAAMEYMATALGKEYNKDAWEAAFKYIGTVIESI